MELLIVLGAALCGLAEMYLRGLEGGWWPPGKKPAPKKEGPKP